MSSVYRQDYFGFIYIWYDTEHKKFCIGSHYGALDDGYTSSTGNSESEIRKRPSDFRRRILYVLATDDRKVLHREERRWLQMIKPHELRVRYYNRTRVPKGRDVGWTMAQEQKDKIAAKLRGRKLPKEVGEKIGAKLRGRKLPPFTEIHRLRMSLSRKGMVRPQTDAERLKRSLTLRGRQFSDESKERMRASQKERWVTDRPRWVNDGERSYFQPESSGMPPNCVPGRLGMKAENLRAKRFCEHCERWFEIGMYGRWHGDNCKQAPAVSRCA